MTVTVWTERESSGIGWTDCTWCSILMVCDGGGNTKWPLGHHTEAERKAFRAGDPRLNFAGGVEHAKSRYGITVASPTPYSQAQLKTALSTNGRIFAVAGKLANFPAGHRLRRWAPTFSGFHAVTVVPLGGGAVTWLDPLAPMGYAGERATAAEVADVFALGNYPNDARYMTAAGDDSMTIVTYTPFPEGNRTWTANTAKVYTGYKPDGTTKKVQLNAGSKAPASGTATIQQNPAKSPNGSGFVLLAAGTLEGYYMVRTDGTVAAPPPPPSGDTAKAKKEGAAEAAKAAAEYAASLP